MDKVGEEKISMARKRVFSMVDASGRHHDAQWRSLMKKFSQAHEEKCHSIPKHLPREQRPKVEFPTNSTYEGSWNKLGMNGEGKFVFPDGEIMYEGEFKSGQFHGDGELKYPDGVTLKAKWVEGKATETRIVFADGLEYNRSGWLYCTMPDRRFSMEHREGLKPAGEENFSPVRPLREIPPGYYDTEDGFYDPNTRSVYRYDDLTFIIRTPSLREQEWIINNCRKADQKPVGALSWAYEEWLQPTLEREPEHLPLGKLSVSIHDEPSMDSDSRRGSKLTATKHRTWLQFLEEQKAKTSSFSGPGGRRESTKSTTSTGRTSQSSQIGVKPGKGTPPRSSLKSVKSSNKGANENKSKQAETKMPWEPSDKMNQDLQMLSGASSTSKILLK